MSTIPALLTLKDIGKIYVSEGNVAVGIRGVNLSFQRGEFVAITGKSGSGKSTLLNVISGMDTYEEGELIINGEGTSYYTQTDWELYREKYISFIFQDYNIIESYTVLQNVELALMHIPDKRQRRKRALELLNRVGMGSHLHHKGSKLSGGQKQRTVIARALAKDSPIILADEPTGNLDSVTSAEIIKLLKEVSADKLLIIVTHNFEQVENYATRHIRIFDGAVESDHTIVKTEPIPERSQESTPPTHTSRAKRSRADISNGITLGSAIFRAKPKLSIFLCLLMLLGTLSIFLITATSGDAGTLFEKKYMFTNIPGRVVVTTRTGEIISEDTLKSIASEYGASSYLHYDRLLDQNENNYTYIEETDQIIELSATYGENYGKPDIGRYPEKSNETLLYIPISYQKTYGKNNIEYSKATVAETTLEVVGIKYYYNNNLTPKALLTEDAFKTVTAITTFNRNANTSFNITASANNGGIPNEYTGRFDIYSCAITFSTDEPVIYFKNAELREFIKKNPDASINTSIQASFYKYNYDQWNGGKSEVFTKNIPMEYITDKEPDYYSDSIYYYPDIIISASLMRQLGEEYLSNTYRQASLFFKSSSAAHEAAEKLCDSGYIAVTADTTYTPDPMETLSEIIGAVFVGIIWLIAILFLAFFINLCSSRVIGAFKGEMSIMRSMGIPVKTIKLGMYVRMFLSLIPAFVFVILISIGIYTVPSVNEIFRYLYAWQYLIIFLGVILLTMRVTQKQIHKLFHQSVKKSLTGGAAE